MEIMETPEEFVAGVQEAKLIGIVRGSSGRFAADAALALMDEGFRYVEVALTTPDALAAIAEIRAKAPAGSLVGAGTVLTVQDVSDVKAAGGQFIVTPAICEAVAEGARQGLPVVAGALTPSEINAGMIQGATVIKLFPASSGGPSYLKALRDPFPQVPFVAVGGVGLDEAEDYWKLGALAVGPGGPLVGDAASVGGDLGPLRLRARAYLALANGFKESSRLR